MHVIESLIGFCSFLSVHIVVVLKAGMRVLMFMEDCGLQGHIVPLSIPLLLIYFGLLSFPFEPSLHFLVPTRFFHPPLAVVLHPSSPRNIPSRFIMEHTFEFQYIVQWTVHKLPSAALTIG